MRKQSTTAEPRIQSMENISLRPRGFAKEYNPTLSRLWLNVRHMCGNPANDNNKIV